MSEPVSNQSAPRSAALLQRWRQARSAQTPDELPRSPEGAPLPLAFAQERLWFLQQMYPDSPGYHLQFAARVEGALQPSALEQSFAALIRRHAILRTAFQAEEGRPHQLVAAEAAFALEHVDLRALPATEQTQRVREQALFDYLQPFDLEAPPLLRARLFRLAEQEHVLVITLHHLISDGWSNGILLRELGLLYDAEATGRPAELPALSHQYADIVVWERRRFEQGALAGALAFWKEHLGGTLPVLQLPLDHPRPAVQGSAGAIHNFRLPKPTLARLQAICQQERATFVMAIMAAFQTLLHRYTGQDDLPVGVPVFNRRRSEAEGLIGMFVNSLVIRTSLAGDPSFRELLGRVRAASLAAYAHQEYPFEKLVEALQPVRDTSHTPIFQAMLSVGAGAEASLNWSGLTLHPYELERVAANFDITLEVTEHSDGTHCALVYRTELFEPATIARMAEHLDVLLTACVAMPDLPISRAPLLTPAERDLIVEQWNDTAVTYAQPHVLHRLIEAQVERSPQETALVFEGQRLSYRELNERANQLAHTLIARGVTPETLVGIAVERSLELVIGLLGILKAGAAYVPLDPSYPRDRLAFMIADAGAPVLLTTTTDNRRPTTEDRGLKIEDSSLDTSEKRSSIFHPPSSAESAVSGPWSVVDLVADWPTIAQAPATNPQMDVTPAHLAYMIYTSGSTGRPKGGLNSHTGIVNRLLWMQQEYGLTSDDRVLQKTPFSFDVSVWEFFWPLMTGARLVIARPEGHRDAAYLAGLIAREGVTTLHFVPSMLQMFLEEPDVARCTSLRRVICSGEALPYDLQQRFFARCGAELHNLYGPTEAAIDVTYWACQRESARRIVPIGRPVANTQIYILDRHMQPVPIGVAGELYIGGIQVGRGYWRRPDLTAEKFVPNPFSTTDDRRPTTDPLDKVTRRQGDKVPESGDAITVLPLHRVTVSDESAVGGQWSVVGSRLYRTGDLCRFLPDGSIEYLSRIDNQIKLRGLRIELGEIEAALMSHPQVREAVTMVREIGPGDVRIVAYFTPPTDDRPPTTDDGPQPSHSLTPVVGGQSSVVGELRAFLAERLPEYMVPAHLIMLDELPLNPSGKLDRKRLPEPQLAAPAQSTMVAPRNAIERTIVGIWEELLRIPSVGTQDNFFELGGHSLLVMQMRARIRERLGFDLSVIDAFRLTTVQALAQHFSRSPAARPAQPPAQNIVDRAAMQRQALQRRRVEKKEQ